MQPSNRNITIHIWLLAALSIVFIWSFIDCFDFYTWVLEAFPVVLGVGVVIVVYRRFRLTNLTLVLIWIHAIILLVGAHYTYARMPLFNWLRDSFDLSRNHYDRLGHFVQGFVPAIIAREVLLRKSPLQKGKWLFFLVICFCLAFSAFFELFEWLVAAISGDDAVAFLATQGDEWDTQKDMALCLIGSLISLLTLSKAHDFALSKIVAAKKL